MAFLHGSRERGGLSPRVLHEQVGLHWWAAPGEELERADGVSRGRGCASLQPQQHFRCEQIPTREVTGWEKLDTCSGCLIPLAPRLQTGFTAALPSSTKVLHGGFLPFWHIFQCSSELCKTLGSKDLFFLEELPKETDTSPWVS